jgi:hypothetical protein
MRFQDISFEKEQEESLDMTNLCKDLVYLPYLESGKVNP